MVNKIAPSEEGFWLSYNTHVYFTDFSNGFFCEHVQNVWFTYLLYTNSRNISNPDT